MSTPESGNLHVSTRTGRSSRRPAQFPALVIGLLAATTGCVTSSQLDQSPPAPPVEQGVEVLNRPLPGPMAALYRMEVPSSGGFRFSVIAIEGGPGRMTVSEPFGGAVILAGWGPTGTPVVLDLREGCRLENGAVPSGFGLEGLPLRRVHRLLAGRLPALVDDVVVVEGDRSVTVQAGRDTVTATLADDPWRVVRVQGPGFEALLDRHTSSLPGRIRFESDSSDKVELELVRLEWELKGEMKAMPDLPPCGSQ